MAHTIRSMELHNGIADQVYAHVAVDYEGALTHTAFVSQRTGGPVVACIGDLEPVFVDNPRRFGEHLDEAWIRRFFKS